MPDNEVNEAPGESVEPDEPNEPAEESVEPVPEPDAEPSENWAQSSDTEGGEE